jgi:hypothetical protein
VQKLISPQAEIRELGSVVRFLPSQASSQPHNIPSKFNLNPTQSKAPLAAAVIGGMTMREWMMELGLSQSERCNLWMPMPTMSS